MDSSHFPTSGTADISQFIHDFSFTYTGFGGTTYSSFYHDPVYVDSAGNFDNPGGPGNQFVMYAPPGGHNVVLNAFANTSQIFAVYDSNDFPVDSGSGNWTLSSPQAVPEPSTFVSVLSCVALAGLTQVWRRRRSDA